MKRCTFALMAVAFGPAVVFAQQDSAPVEDSNGYRPIGVAPERQGQPVSQASPRGPGQWQPLGPFGGDVEDINVSPTSPNVVLAGVAPSGSIGGALYRSTDSGATWAIVPSVSNENSQTISVYDIEFAPNGDAWVATDDSVYLSTDNGATFTKHDLGIGLNDQTFAIEIDPTNPMVLWVGVADAIGSQPMNVLKSEDGGNVWVDMTPAGVAGTSATDIAINPDNPDEVMVTFGGAFGGGAVYFTSTGGMEWSDVTAGLPGNPARTVRYSDGAWLVGGGQLFGSQFFGLWRSPDDGVTWTQLDNGWPNSIATAVAVDPNNPQVILAASPNGLHKSIDGGTTWTISAGGTGSFSMNAVRFAPGSSTRVVAGASSFGVVLSDDAADTTRVSSVGIGALDVWSVVANPANTNELAVAFQGQNNGGVYASTDGGQTWQVQSAPGTRYNAVKFDASGTLYALSDGPSGIAPEAVYRRNGDGTWTNLGPDQGNLFETELFSIDFGQADPNLFLTSGNDFGVAGFEGTIWRSPNAGMSWDKEYESPTGQSAVAYAVHIIKDGTDQTAVAGLQSFTADAGLNGVFRSTNGGVSWDRVTAGLPESLWGYDIQASPDDPNRIYVANGNFSGGGIWASDDAGANWSSFLEGFNTRGIAIDPNNADSIYFWTVFAAAPVYQATENGTVVTPMSDGLMGGPRQITSAAGPNPRILLATTVGAYQLTLGGPPSCPADFNNDQVVNSQDFFDFLNAFFDQDPSSDFNGDHVVNSQDFFDFLNAFFMGCP
jgi:hypothetical protein